MTYFNEEEFGYDTDPEPENEEAAFYDKQFEIFRAYAASHQNDPGIQRAKRIVKVLGDYADTRLYYDIFLETEPFQSLYVEFKKAYEKKFNEPFDDLELMFLEPLEDTLINSFVEGVSELIRNEKR
ncbi:hypothetical protein SRCM101294_00785 [Bacillus amyloliquefaciens]|uniref:hypothetical protein n=1 Tax=Bacillus TaxID=1386 RepID=UPI00080C3A4C|nr:MULTISPECIES: hypothetical protein [Bacillus subtilis group]OCB98131.1 hypothetical protein SRCM101294_00785 [Bacillus amyloliquefaciens]QEO08534.1 hypothetical protein FLQ07_23455 [Bacillus paralicheniformis]